MRVRCHLLMFTRLPDRANLNFNQPSFWGHGLLGSRRCVKQAVITHDYMVGPWVDVEVMCVDNDRYSFRHCLIVRAMRRALPPTLERDLRPPDSFQDQLLHFGIVSRNIPVRIIPQEIRKAFSRVERIHSSYGIERGGRTTSCPACRRWMVR